MKIQNVSSLGDLVVPAAGVTVLAGDVVDLNDDLAASLLDQPDNWARIDEPAQHDPSTGA